LVAEQDLGSCVLMTWGFESLHPHKTDKPPSTSDNVRFGGFLNENIIQ